MPEVRARIRAEFTSHAITGPQATAMDEIRIGFSDLLTKIEDETEPGRERAIVATKLQEACMFAIRAIALRTRPRDS